MAWNMHRKREEWVLLVDRWSWLWLRRKYIEPFPSSINKEYCQSMRWQRKGCFPSCMRKRAWFRLGECWWLWHSMRLTGSDIFGMLRGSGNKWVLVVWVCSWRRPLVLCPKGSGEPSRGEYFHAIRQWALSITRRDRSIRINGTCGCILILLCRGMAGESLEFYVLWSLIVARISRLIRSCRLPANSLSGTRSEWTAVRSINIQSGE